MNRDTIVKIQEYADTECFRLFIRLFNELIDSNRVKNDTATGEEVVRNQGAIQQLRDILKIQVVRPSKYTAKDGAFN